MTLKNLGYRKLSTPHGDEVGVDRGDDIGGEDKVGLILNALAEEPKITQKNLAAKVRLSTRTVSREIRELRDSGAIRRVGSDRSGHWEIAK
ncbi:MAG: winged helix-turn-helix domain-containing protein [Candidatus Accumulibacter sp.]|nr:winged helix-turn-helix domain-containing protein [Accumulibacter sp.]